MKRAFSFRTHSLPSERSSDVTSGKKSTDAGLPNAERKGPLEQARLAASSLRWSTSPTSSLVLSRIARFTAVCTENPIRAC
jgi:hypothetical protein